MTAPAPSVRNAAWAALALSPLAGTISINLLAVLLIAGAAAAVVAEPRGGTAALRRLAGRHPAAAGVAALLVAYALASIWTGIAGGDPRSLRELAAPVALIGAGGLMLAAPAGEGADASRVLMRLKWLMEAAFVLSAAIIAVQAAADFPVQRLLHMPMDRWNPHIKTFDRSVIFVAATLFAYVEIAGRVLAGGEPRGRWERLRTAVALACALGIVAGMANETAKAATAAGLAAWAIVRWTGLRPRLSWLVAALMAQLCVIVPFMSAFADACAAHASRIPETFVYRCYIWKYATQVVGERPALGLGFDGSRYITRTFARPWPAGLPNAERFPFSLHPHNNFLQLWVELGAVGVLLILALGVIWLLSRRRDVALSGGELATAVVLFIVANLSFGVWQTNWLATVVIPVALLALCRRLGPERPAGSRA